MPHEPVEEQIRRLERRLRFVSVAVGLLLLALVGVGTLAWQQNAPPDELRLRSLVIVDENGVERIRLGGELPDAVIQGRRVPRGARAAGILLYDDTGQERGGYVTFSPSGNVALTLDTRHGQVALFAADPDDGAVARLWHGDGADWIEMRSDRLGTRLTIARSNEIVVQEPPVTKEEAAAYCAAFKEELRQQRVELPLETVLRACKQRMSDAVCRECLGIR